MRMGRQPVSAAGTSGFTLLEVLVVLAILGLLTTLVMPPLRLNEGARLREQVHSLAADIRLARQEAIRRGVPTAIVPAATGYLLQPSGRTTNLFSGFTVTAQAGQAHLVPQPDDRIRFFPDGSSTGGTLSVGSSRSRISITIRGIDGKVWLNDS
jgi:general secretion pathway protein H